MILPLDLTPTGTGNPLAEREDFVQTTCPKCGGAATRETDTLDCHFDALWLWVPVCVPPAEREQSLEHILALEDLRAWLPCERVVAGSDSGNFVFDQRTVTKALRDIGPLEFLSDGEPFAGCLFHEMVITRWAQDEQAPWQRGRSRRAGGAVWGRHRALGGALRRTRTALAELERWRRQALSPLFAPALGLLACSLHTRSH